MRPQRWAIIGLCVLTSCVRIDDQTARTFAIGIHYIGELAEASVRYRQQMGVWPAQPADLRALITDPNLQLDRVEKIMSFRVEQRGLGFVNRSSGETSLVVANESTPQHLVYMSGG